MVRGSKGRGQVRRWLREGVIEDRWSEGWLREGVVEGRGG